MKYYYDLHIHSSLSPCADNDMTVNNIVNFASLVGLDIIAVSDHNSVGNVKAVMRAVKQNELNLLVVPAVEMTTSEDIHILILFSSLSDAQNASKEIAERQLKIKNKPHIFGDQLYLNEFDEVIGEEEKLLIVATNISSEEACDFAKRYNAVAVPAHIDKPSNSMLAILGAVDDSSGFATVEMTANATQKLKDEFILRGYNIISNSDSHMLGVLNEPNENNSIELQELSASCLVKTLSQKRC